MKKTFTINGVKASQRKGKFIVKLLKGLRIEEAIIRMKLLNKRICISIINLLKNCINITKDKDLLIEEAYITKGQQRRQVSFRGKGGLDYIMKRTSKISVVVQGGV